MKKNTLDHNILQQFMTSEEYTKMLKTSRKTSLSKGKILFHYGNAAPVFYLVTSGKIKLYRTTAAGREKTFKTYTKGKSIGIILMFIPNGYYPMTAQAEQDSELIVVKKGYCLSW